MRERDYTADHDHVSWLYTARKAAEREHDALEALYPEVSVPQPVGHNRHAVVMEKIDGVELSRTKLTDAQVVPVLELVLDEMATAYTEGYVHADMSEYNVFVTEQGVVVFDWPQAVPTDHDNARELLERDIDNIAGYFARKYPSHVDGVDVSGLAAALAENSFDSLTEYVD
jgi:RIO kinase 2